MMYLSHITTASNFVDSVCLRSSGPVDSIQDASVTSVVVMSTRVHIFLFTHMWVARRRNVQTESREFDIPMTPEKQEAEYWLGKYVENAVENSFRIRVDDITALAETPSNGIKKPDADGQDAANVIRPFDGAPKNTRAIRTHNHQRIYNVGKGNHAKGPVSPLVARLNKGTYQASDNHDLVGNDDSNDVVPRHSSRQHEVREKKRCGNDPVNVANVENLPGTRRGDLTVVVSDEFGLDRNLAQVRAHGEIGYSSHK